MSPNLTFFFKKKPGATSEENADSDPGAKNRTFIRNTVKKSMGSKRLFSVNPALFVIRRHEKMKK